MLEKIAGTYELKRGVIHVLVVNEDDYNSKIAYDRPCTFSTVCRTHTGITDANVYVNLATTKLSGITCKRCLRKLELDNDQLHRPKVIDHLARPVELAGAHYDHHSGAMHAMVSDGNAIKTICGTTFPDDTYPYRPWPNNTNDRHRMVSSITCQRCLKVLASGGIVPDKPDPVPIELLGVYSFADGPRHALIKREPKVTDYGAGDIPKLRSLCNDYPDVYCSDNYQGNPASSVTCKKCLRMLEIPNPKKFFLVFYKNNAESFIGSFDKMLDEVDKYRGSITKILLIDSYKEVFVDNVTIITDKDGNEITEEDL